jgi:hypothetical protein
MKTALALLVALFAGVGGLAAADPQSGPLTRAVNTTLPAWLRIGGEERVRLEALDGIGFLPSANAYVLQRLRLNVDLRAAAWLRFSFQAQDSRVFGSTVRPAPSSLQNRADLRLAFVQLGDSESSRWSLRAGRQSLSFGESRLLADPNWSNVGRAFDAVRVTFRYGGVRVDGFSGASVKADSTAFDRAVPGQRVHGVYGSIERLVPRAVVEPYLIVRVERDSRRELGGSSRMEEKVVGVRWTGKLPRRTDYAIEMASQFGLVGAEPIRAWAVHWVAGYTLAETALRPRLYAEFNRASGDQNPRDGVHGAFDPLFPSAHDKFGLADQFTWTNIEHARSGIQVRARKNLSLGAALNSFWLANRRDGIYSSGKVGIASNGRQGNHIGNEADLQAQWNVSRDTTLDAGYGYLVPGGFLRAVQRSTHYHALFLSLAQRF